MSLYYKESNQESTKDLFEKRIIYKGTLARAAEGNKNLVNFNFGEKLLFGRVDRRFVPITLNQTFLPLKTFAKANSAAKNLQAVNFVVDAFNGLALQFKRCAMAGQISQDDPFLSNLTVYKAFEDPEQLYSAYLTTSFESIAAEFRRRHLRVKDFNGFLKELELILQASAPLFPFTQPGYVKSRLCPISVSGLAVEIADLKYANDEEKIAQFVNSKNWEFYVNACREYGFMVDRSIPWRLVADIGIQPTRSTMFDYANVYGYTTTNQILGSGYGVCHIAFFKKFKFFLLNLYNKVKLSSFIETRQCGQRSISVKVFPQSYAPTQLSEVFSDAAALRFYFKLRFMEEESQFKAFEQEMLMDDCQELYAQKGSTIALEAFERILNKTFDYSGSLSYIRRYMESSSVEGP